MRTAAALLLLALAAGAQDGLPPDADGLIGKMRAAYLSLDTYAHRGLERMELPESIPFASRDALPVRAFLLRFDRGRGFRFEFRMRQDMGLGLSFSHEHVALWGDRDECRLWSRDGGTRTYDDIEDALEAADDRSGRLAGFALRPLLDLYPGERGDASEPTLDTVDGVPCWRVTFSTELSGGSTWSRTLWIEADRFLLRRVDWRTIEIDGDAGLGSSIRIFPEPDASIPAAELSFDPEAGSSLLEFGSDDEWDFAFDSGGGDGGALDLPKWLPWSLFGTGLLLAVVFVVVLRRAARRHAASPRPERLPRI